MGSSENFFCASMSRASGEDIIGNACEYQTYVLVECPYPWASKPFESKFVPESLKTLVEKVKQAKLPVNFLLFTADKFTHQQSTRVMIFRQKLGFSDGYYKSEFQAENITEAASILRSIFIKRDLEIAVTTSTAKDFFICTHGSRDQCCARYGYPFYRQAVAMAANLNLKDVRFWQISHIGGHRFAPTMISFPEGRYYGALDEISLQTILLRQGELDCFKRVYRGWGILPRKVQVLERELIFRHGWEWFEYQALGKILYKDAERNVTKVELKCGKMPGKTLTYQADIVADEAKTQYLYGSCHSNEQRKFTKYRAVNICSVQSPEKMSVYPLVSKNSTQQYESRCRA